MKHYISNGTFECEFHIHKTLGPDGNEQAEFDIQSFKMYLHPGIKMKDKFTHSDLINAIQAHLELMKRNLIEATITTRRDP